MWLQVDPEEKSASYRITWGKGLPYPLSYAVEQKRLHGYADQLRDALQQLADVYRNPPDDAERCNKLAALASAGRDFEDQLFFWAAEKRSEIKALRVFLEREFATNDKSLEVRAPASLQVPWGVVYRGEPPSGKMLEAVAKEPAEKRLKKERELFGNFWCLRYQELSITRGKFARAQCEMRRPKHNFGILPLLNSTVETQVHDIANGCETVEHDLFADCTRSQEHCREVLENTKFRDIVFYFLGHHRNSSLRLGGDEVITDAQFSRLMEQLAETIASGPASSCGLVFLNACESAFGEGFNLRSYTETAELCGSIATESKIPIPQAHRLGVRLLHLLKFDGKSVGEAFRLISDDPDFWPLCLMYGRYASPNYAIQTT